MKKLVILLLVAVLGTVTVQAQDFAAKIKGPTTLTNAATDTVSVTITGAKQDVIFKYAITKTSGTVAGTIVLQSKLTTDAGEGWETLNTYNLVDQAGTTLNRVAYTTNPGRFYRIITTTTGTQVSVHNKYLLYRK